MKEAKQIDSDERNENKEFVGHIFVVDGDNSNDDSLKQNKLALQGRDIDIIVNVSTKPNCYTCQLKKKKKRAANHVKDKPMCQYPYGR